MILHQSLSSDIRATSSGFDKLLRIVAEAVTVPVPAQLANTANSTQLIGSAHGRLLPNHGLIVPDVPVTLPAGSKSKRSHSWSITVKHWEEGDPAHGLGTPLKDWRKEWLRGASKPLAIKYTNRRTMATEFIDQYKVEQTGQDGT
ncbi:hypothetical protein R3P38DRAFT_1317048 [Favolaschia claudopus]|uniref:Uncharacterized protein n=1 Tax=Favolaschia claudopus TaxID=2862362 RepID=A0AAW0AWF5_9AGAR